MIDYKDFVIPEFYWDYFVREKRSLFISSYLKDNNILPSEDMIKNFIIDEKEREDFRRMLYSKYCISGVMPEIPVVPILPDNPDIPEETIKMVNVTFGIEINDFIPFNDGIAETNNDVVNIFKNGINFMHLLEKDDRDIEIIINNDKEHIILSNLSDFNKTYNIPAGTYNISGHIGERGGTDTDNPIIRFYETLEIYSSGEIKLHGTCNELLIISDKEFCFLDYTGREYNSYNYNGYYYWFDNKYMTYHWVKIDDKEYMFKVSDYYGESHDNQILYYYINSKDDGEKYVNVSFDIDLKMSYNDMDGFEENEELINEFLNGYIKNSLLSSIEDGGKIKLNDKSVTLNKMITIPIGNYFISSENLMFEAHYDNGQFPKNLNFDMEININNSGNIVLEITVEDGLLISNGDFWQEDTIGKFGRSYWNGYVYWFMSDILNYPPEDNTVSYNTNKGYITYIYKNGQYSYYKNEENIFDEKHTIICTYNLMDYSLCKIFSEKIYGIIDNYLIDDFYLNPSLHILEDGEYYDFNNIGEHTIKITLKDKTDMTGLEFMDTCLSNIVIPESVKILSTRERATTFNNCINLIKIKCDSVEAPTFIEGSKPFEGCRENGLLQIQKGASPNFSMWLNEENLNTWAAQEK